MFGGSFHCHWPQDWLLISIYYIKKVMLENKIKKWKKPNQTQWINWSHFCHLNLFGLRNKLNQIRILIKTGKFQIGILLRTGKFDILAITESKLDTHILDDDVLIKG